MPTLDSDKHEAFAFLIARATDSSKAYAQVYEREVDETARVNGLKLLRNATIAARIAEIRGLQAQSAVIEVASVIADAPDFFSRIGRAKSLREDFERLETIRVAQAKMYAGDPDVPGGETGFKTKMTRAIGKFGTEVVHKLDIDLLGERRALRVAVARELGQYIEKTESTTKAPGDWSMDEWSVWLAEQEAKTGVPVSVVQADLEAQEKPN